VNYFYPFEKLLFFRRILITVWAEVFGITEKKDPAVLGKVLYIG
jgi:hypothetical protein